MHQNQHITAALMIALASGSCLAQQSSQKADAQASSQNIAQGTQSVRLASTQIQSIQQAFNWFDRDADILNNPLTPRTIFIEYPGLKERSEYLNVQVKSQDQMIQQLAFETNQSAATRPVNQSQTRAADAPDAATTIQAQINARIVGAEQRILDARNRIAPATRQAYLDVDMHSIKIPAGVSAELAAEALMLTGDYEFVSIDWICYPVDTTPNDSLFSSQWYHPSNRIDTVGAWDVTQGFSSTIIGVVDSGVDIDHPDLAAALVPGYNSVDNLAEVDGGIVNDTLVGHGTLVAGSAAAIGNNGTGISGIGWNFGIMPIKVTNNNSGTAALSEILEGARWASDNGAYAANCSFGGAEDIATASTGGHIRLEGHLLVFAAGNDGIANQTRDWEDVTIVGASNSADNWANFSHTGVGIDCIAPGVNIRSTNRTGGYSFTTGTSFSAPITAGALMLVHDANPSLSADEVEYILLNSCDDFQAIGEDDQTGWGRINVGQAVQDAVFGPSITNLPFSEEFPDATLSTDWRNPVGDVDVSQNAVNIPSGLYALNLDDTDSIETIKMRAAFLGGSPAEIQFYAEHRGVEAGETLAVEYFNLLSNWAPLTTIVSNGTNQEEFIQYRIAMPTLGNHDEFKLRFAANGSDDGDDWYIDDVKVQEFSTNAFPWEESFEDGITLTLDWASSSADASEDANNEPDGIMSARLTQQDSMTSADVDVTTATSVIYVHFHTQHLAVESGESLNVEYKTQLGAWNTLMSVESDGTDQSSFELSQIALPFDAYGGNTALRFTADGDEADDTWFLDAIAITTEFIEEQTCPADLTGDGTLNFFDISAFLTAFNAQDPIADFTDDGSFNFFDVSAFLVAFNTGCP